jgi:hypothetical protein
MEFFSGSACALRAPWIFLSWIFYLIIPGVLQNPDKNPLVYKGSCLVAGKKINRRDLLLPT